MKREAFTLIEIGIVFLLILLVTSLTIPLILDDSKQAKEISEWRHTYEDILYTFQSVKFQSDDESVKSLTKKLHQAKTVEEKENILVDDIAPFLRITNPFEPKRYTVKYMNSEKSYKEQYYYFSNLYNTELDTIVGIKWLGKLYENAPFAMLMFDLNGEKAPNTWGRDVFGVNLYEDKIEPFGKGLNYSEVNADCSKKGRGVYCSYDYLIGAQF